MLKDVVSKGVFFERDDLAGRYQGGQGRCLALRVCAKCGLDVRGRVFQQHSFSVTPRLMPYTERAERSVDSVSRLVL